jgi:hypothetical protein
MGTRSVEADQGVTPTIAHAPTRIVHGERPKSAGLEKVPENEKAEIRMGRIFEKRKESIFKTAAQKSKLYSKYGRQLYMAAKSGVPDPDANPTLRSLVERAKRDKELGKNNLVKCPPPFSNG